MTARPAAAMAAEQLDTADVLNVCGFALYVPYNDGGGGGALLEIAAANPAYALEVDSLLGARTPAALALTDWARTGLRRATLAGLTMPRWHVRCSRALETRLFANPPRLLVVASETVARALAAHYPGVRTVWPALRACVGSRVRACVPRCTTCATVRCWESLP